MKFFKQLVEFISVLGNVDTFGRGAEDFYGVAVKEFGKLDCRLAAECHNNAHRLFNLDDVHNILGAERLKIKPVARVKVG